MTTVQTFKDRKIFLGQKVSAFFNLHTKEFSMQGNMYEQYEKTFYTIKPENKNRTLVLAHGNGIMLTGASFVVRESGRQRVLKEKRKNIHAFVKGNYQGSIMDIISTDFEQFVKENKIREAYYNPYTQDCFTDKETGEKIEGKVLYAVLMDKKVYYRKSLFD